MYKCKMGISQNASMRNRHPVFVIFLILIIVVIFNLLSSWGNGTKLSTSRKTNLQTKRTQHTLVRNAKDKLVSRFVRTKSKSRKSKPFSCPRGSKGNQYMSLKFKGGRTGNALFQLFCLLSFSSQYCYTAIIDDVILHNSNFRRLLPTFEISNTSIQRVKHIDRSTFHNFTTKMVRDLKSKRQNWMLIDYCFGYKNLQGHEEYIKSSVRFRPEIKDDVHKYLQTNFDGRSTVAIHVRRTDKLNKQPHYKYTDLKWYRPFIEKAVRQLKVNFSNLSFIFVSDDLTWCRDNFQDEHMHFSPFGDDVGRDLALIASCDHVILTIGTFGWMGAWLGDHKTVIYSSKYVPTWWLKRDINLPSWIGLGD